jgi:hypothetical protein
MNYKLILENKHVSDTLTLKMQIFWFWVTIKKIHFMGLNYIGRKEDVEKTIIHLVVKYSIPGNQIFVYEN